MENCWSGSRISQNSIASSYQKKKKKSIALTVPVVQTVFGLRCLIIGQHSWSGPRNYGNEIWKLSWSIGVLLASNVISKASMSSQL